MKRLPAPISVRSRVIGVCYESSVFRDKPCLFSHLGQCPLPSPSPPLSHLGHLTGARWEALGVLAMTEADPVETAAGTAAHTHTAQQGLLCTRDTEEIGHLSVG